MLDLRVMRIALATLLWVTSLADCSVSDGCFEDDVALELLQAKRKANSLHVREAPEDPTEVIMNITNLTNLSNVTNVTNVTKEVEANVTISTYLDGVLKKTQSGPLAALKKGIEVLKEVSPDAELRIEDDAGHVINGTDMQPGNTYKIYVNLQNLKDVAPMNASNASNASNATVRVVNVTGNETVEGDVDVTIDVYLDGKLMNSASGPKSNLLKGIDVLKTVSPDAEVTIKDETGQVVHEEDMKPGQKYEIYVRT